ncbi:MAG: hypothetical protein LBK05_08305 [Treponema sp.]|jgi:vacuolar-type H+-ATPase subunit H|nr:hypothetical protein [Treponema sp.]
MAVIARGKKALDTLSGTDAEPWPPEGDSDAGGSDQDILRHLLDVEDDAQSLVDDAQAEADRRIAETEKQNRARYEEQYTREAALLDSRYETALKEVREEYSRHLDEYRLGLDKNEPDYAGFCRLMDDLLGICSAPRANPRETAGQTLPPPANSGGFNPLGMPDNRGFCAAGSAKNHESDGLPEKDI